MAQLIGAGERLFNVLRRLRPSQRVVQIAICRGLASTLEAVGGTEAATLAAVINAVCARFDSKGRAVK